MTPGTGPAAVQTVTRAPTSWIGSQPPIGCTDMKPSESMYWTMRPIWSQWPARSMRVDAPAFFAPMTLPWESVVTVSAQAARYSRTTAWIGCS